jgi:hypothetical protein
VAWPKSVQRLDLSLETLPLEYIVSTSTLLSMFLYSIKDFERKDKNWNWETIHFLCLVDVCSVLKIFIES